MSLKIRRWMLNDCTLKHSADPALPLLGKVEKWTL
jgi:hypothetical protein